MTRLFFSLLAVLLALDGVALGQTSCTASAARVIPHPQIEDYEQGVMTVAERDADVSISARDTDLFDSGAVNTARGLLSKRLAQLGSARLTTVTNTKAARILVEKCPEQQMTAALRARGAKRDLSGKRLMQAYVLQCSADADGTARIVIRACGDRGIYYAMVSLCQLLDRDDGGDIVVPVVKLADWPEIGLRLAKTSASSNPLPYLDRFANWMPLYKIGGIGLQFHGDDSKHPGPFPENVKAICSSAEEQDVLETVVYFCPFRGQGYDFNVPADRAAYADLIRSVFKYGADGFEVDYNDWPGKNVPIEDVINLAHEVVAEASPDAYLLYCPPNRGISQYRGPATPEMRRILSKVPENVWPLWTGMTTLIEKPLEVEQVEQWTRAAGRRPFLWVNRVTPRVDRAFTRTVEEVPGVLVFRGDLLPKELDRLFEGVHFNAGFSAGYNDLPKRFDTESLVYMATAADYVWNPQSWEPAESARRAQRFVSIMRTLVEE